MRNTSIVAAAIVVLAACSAEVRAQERPAENPAVKWPPTAAEEASQTETEAWMKTAVPGEEHRRLARLAGTWDVKTKLLRPTGEVIEVHGTAVREMALGGRVLEERLLTETMGQAIEARKMIGFDRTTGSFWSTSTDSLSTDVVVGRGACNAELDCAFASRQPNAMAGTTRTLREVITRPTPNTEVHEVFELDTNGKETKVAVVEYARQPTPDCCRLDCCCCLEPPAGCKCK